MRLRGKVTVQLPGHNDTHLIAILLVQFLDLESMQQARFNRHPQYREVYGRTRLGPKLSDTVFSLPASRLSDDIQT